MKKFLIIFGIIVILALLVWVFFGGNSNSPKVEGPSEEAPFGTPSDVVIPGLGPDTVGKTTEFDSNFDSEVSVFRVSNVPVAGFVPFTRDGNSIIRFVERATGHIIDFTLPKPGEAQVIKTKITNTTLPKIYEAYFTQNGSSVLLRSLEGTGDEVRNMTLTLTPPRSTSTDSLYSVSATNLRGDIGSLAINGASSIIYVLKNSSAIASSNFTGGNLRTLFTTSFTSWKVGRMGNNILVYTKASAEAPGYAYSIPGNGGGLTKILGPLNGLTAISNPAGTKLLYSYYEGGRTRLFARSVSGANTVPKEILPATLSEKCVWSTKNQNVFFCGTPLSGISSFEPDNWYLGKTHFTDYIWKFNTDSDTTELIAEPKTSSGLDLDVFGPQLTPNEDFFIFINKRDMTLWAVRI